ncbi:MAG: hypothetical protein MMC33_009179, partial [Icmadophila ericetorum]|nr:hypothetical protein [Icmadophila ericetorum]
IPGHHFPPIILGLLLTYLASFSLTATKTPKLAIVAEEVDIIYKDEDEGKVGEVEIVESEDEDEGEESEGQDEGEESEDEDEAEGEEEQLEVELRRTTLLAERDPQIVKTLLFGLPSPSSTFWSSVTVGINILLALFVADMVFRAPLFYPSHDLSFARVGYVSHDTAKILVREPNASKVPVYVSYRKAYSTSNPTPTWEKSWHSGGSVYWLDNSTDYTHVFEIQHLIHSTLYQYTATNTELVGTFTTAPLPKEQSTGYRGTKLTFFTSSCIKPHFPYSPFSHPLSIPGLKYLAAWIPKVKASFMLFLGDFIYIDVPLRLGRDPETYRRDYRQVYSSPDWPAVSKDLPWIHVIDDHEIANDWDAKDAAPYPSAIDPYRIYHESLNPPTPPGSELDATYFQFTNGPAQFFMLDTRSYRTPSSGSPWNASKTMLGYDQYESLRQFLMEPPPEGIHFKFIISSIPFTSNWRVNAADTWSGYLYERQALLEIMWEATSTYPISIVILSGDRHEFASTAFTPPKSGGGGTPNPWHDDATIYEFSVSPLSMFYLPFQTYWEDNTNRTLKNLYGEEKCIKYHPEGNSKFGIVDVEPLVGGEQSLLRYRLVVDGLEIWEFTVTSPRHERGDGGRRLWE